MKIKDSVDLKELKKFGFIYGKEYMHKEHLGYSYLSLYTKKCNKKLF